MGRVCGEKAYRLAIELCEQTSFGNPSYLDTLSVAHAANGNFKAAARTAAEAVRIAQEVGATEFAADVGERLELFLSHRPYVETNPLITGVRDDP